MKTAQQVPIIVPSKVIFSAAESDGRDSRSYHVELIDIDMFTLPEGIFVAPLVKVTTLSGRPDTIDFVMTKLILLPDSWVADLTGFFSDEQKGMLATGGILRYFPEFSVVSGLPKTVTKYDFCLEFDGCKQVQRIALPKP